MDNDNAKNPNTNQQVIQGLEEILINKNLIASKINDKLLENVDAIGFDVDHTISLYNTDQMIKLLYNAFAQFLIIHKNYPKELEMNIGIFSEELVRQYSASEVCLDLLHGNAICMNDQKLVIKAFHGIDELDEEQIAEYYGQDKTFSEFDFNMPRTARYIYVLGNFDYQCTAIFLFSVDLFDNGKMNDSGCVKCYQDIWNHIIEAVVFNYLLHDPKTNTIKDFRTSGYYFPEIYNNPKTYISTYSAKDMLLYLKSKGIVVFFATNSYYEYADFILKNSIGEDYLDYFDLGFFYALKPSFFKKDNMISCYIPDVGQPDHKGKEIVLQDIEEKSKVFECIKNKSNHCFLMGSYRFVEEYCKAMTGKENVSIIYAGDNFNSDCYKPSQLENWGSIAIDDRIEVGDGVIDVCGYPSDFRKIWSMEKEKNLLYRKILRDNILITLPHVEYLRYFQ